MQAVTTIGLDIAKSVFQVHGVVARVPGTRPFGAFDAAFLMRRYSGESKPRSIICVLPFGRSV